MKETRPLTAGRLAREAGVNLQTIRYYERRGLLPAPPRSPSGYRAYPVDAVRRVRFVKRAQALGFTLGEIEELLSVRADSRASCAEVRKVAEAKIADIDARLAGMHSMRRALGRLVSVCPGEVPKGSCPILEFLEDGAPVPPRRSP